MVDVWHLDWDGDGIPCESRCNGLYKETIQQYYQDIMHTVFSDL